MISPAPELHYLPHAIVTALIAGVGWLGKYFGSQLVKEWRDAKEKLIAIEATTRVQAENHLHTIEANTAKTNELLTKVVDGQIEMNGWLKGRASRG